MSVTESVPPYVFEQKGTFDAPFEYTVPGSLEIRPDTASATFDGTGAGGDFLACLTFISPEGSRLCRMFNPNPVKAGDVAEVTFIPPFGAAASSSGTGSGIQFDTYPQSGTFLEVATTGESAFTSSGIQLEATDHPISLIGHSTDIDVGADGIIDLDCGGDLILNTTGDLNASSAVQMNLVTSGGPLVIENDGNTDTHFNSTGGGDLFIANGDLGSNTNTVLVRDGNTSGNFGVEITTLNGNDVRILADSPAHGSPNTDRWVIVQPNLQLYTFSGEPDAAGDDNGAALYLTSPDGGTTVHLKVVFSNGTRVTLASN